jgi:hypothetical protein
MTSSYPRRRVSRVEPRPRRQESMSALPRVTLGPRFREDDVHSTEYEA